MKTLGEYVTSHPCASRARENAGPASCAAVDSRSSSLDTSTLELNMRSILRRCPATADRVGTLDPDERRWRRRASRLRARQLGRERGQQVLVRGAEGRDALGFEPCRDVGK